MVTPPMARCDRRVKETRRRKADSTKGVQQKKKGYGISMGLPCLFLSPSPIITDGRKRAVH
jgi:hypothetical protein